MKIGRQNAFGARVGGGGGVTNALEWEVDSTLRQTPFAAPEDDSST
jgi:hypothetical protein